MLKLNNMNLYCLAFVFYLLCCYVNVVAAAAPNDQNAFTPKASLIRYWETQISNDLPKPWFLLTKASPLSAAELATFSKLANDQNALADNLLSFCSAADLLCFPDLSPPSLEKVGDDSPPLQVNKNKYYAGEGRDSPPLQVNKNKYYAGEGRDSPPLQVNKNKYYAGEGRDSPPLQVNKNKYYAGEGRDSPPLQVNKNKYYAGEGRDTPPLQVNKNKYYAGEGRDSPPLQVNKNKYYAGEGRDSPPLQVNKKKYGGNATVNKRVEPGMFFRERMLKMGTVIPMPDIKDKMPKRSFLPRVIASKLPFSTSKIEDMKKIFHAAEHPIMERMLEAAVRECERAPSAGETKRCVGSGEDMIDFAVSVLGRDAVVRATENTEGSKKLVIIGKVIGINGGMVTKSVSCHQTLFPFMLYYCHSVPKVRLYEADILDMETKAKINHGVAICHVDTSSWRADHVAFVALGSGPGKTEVCHWMYENEMNWAVAD